MVKANVGPLLSVLDSREAYAYTSLSLSLFNRKANETGKRLSSAKHAVGPLIDSAVLPCTKLINETFMVAANSSNWSILSPLRLSPPSLSFS